MQIAIIAPSHVPFIVGGAEKLWWGILEYINKHTRHQCDLIRIPSKEDSFWNLIDTYYTFYCLDLSHFDIVISGKYPGWMVRHHNHHIYMLHTLRSVYDFYDLNKWGDEVQTKDLKIQYVLDKLNDHSSSVEEIFELLFELKTFYSGSLEQPFNYAGVFMRKIIHFFDKKAMENIHRFAAISNTVANRKEYFPLGTQVEVIHPPSNLEKYTNHSYDYFFTVSRLDYPKRIDMIVKAYLKSNAILPLKIAGTGPLTKKLKTLSKNDKRIELLGFVSDDEIIEYYAGAYAIIFIPRDEDYGLVTVEAMMCEKPVLTFTDSGGVLEFVEDKATGLVCEPNIEALTKNINYISDRPDLCRSMGKKAKKRVIDITWENTIEKLIIAPTETKRNSMIKAEQPDIEEILLKIKNESQKKQKMTAEPVKSTAKPLKNTVSQKFKKGHICIEDLMQYYDTEFIANLYRGILGREPDEKEFRKGLALLRSGKRSKIDLLTSLRFSPEGKEKNITIPGIKKRYIVSRLFMIPVLGYLLRLVTLQRTTRRLNWLEAKMFMEINKLRSDSIDK